MRWAANRQAMGPFLRNRADKDRNEPRDLSLTRGSVVRSPRSEAAPRVKDSPRADIRVQSDERERVQIRF